MTDVSAGPMAASVAAADQIPVIQGGAVVRATVAQIVADPVAQIAALAARVAILEAKPEEVAHFTGSGTFPTAAVGGTFVLRLTGIAPARAGDALVPGEQVVAWATGKPPAGVDMGAPSVAADGSVLIPCTASLLVSAGTAPVPFAIAALR